MEAETPPPAAEPTPPPPPPPPVAGEEKASGGRRFGAVVLALVLGFGAAVMIAVSVEIGDTVPCEEGAAAVIESGQVDDQGNPECFDGSSGQKTASLVLTWPGGVIGVVAALAALMFAIRGRGGALVARLSVAAIALSGLGILVGSV